ncbi:kinase-like protein, partial [Rozella allomycis CSF55]
QVGDCLGKGAFATVYRCININTGNCIAIKQVKCESMKKSELGAIRAEIELLKRLKHDNIVEYIGSSEEDGYLNIMLELCENGSLVTICKKFGKIPESLVSFYISQVLKGLCFLHDQGVIHRDIKGANILTTKDGRVKLADFGVSVGFSDTQDDSMIIGSPYWMTPEVIELSGVNTGSDIWSVGCTTIELIQGQPPYFHLSPMAALYRIVNDEHPPLPDGISNALKDFLMLTFQKDVNLRVSASKLLRHPWITKGHEKHMLNDEENFESAMGHLDEFVNSIDDSEFAEGSVVRKGEYVSKQIVQSSLIDENVSMIGDIKGDDDDWDDVDASTLLKFVQGSKNENSSPPNKINFSSTIEDENEDYNLAFKLNDDADLKISKMKVSIADSIDDLAELELIRLESKDFIVVPIEEREEIKWLEMSWDSLLQCGRYEQSQIKLHCENLVSGIRKYPIARLSFIKSNGYFDFIQALEHYRSEHVLNLFNQDFEYIDKFSKLGGIPILLRFPFYEFATFVACDGDDKISQGICKDALSILLLLSNADHDFQLLFYELSNQHILLWIKVLRNICDLEISHPLLEHLDYIEILADCLKEPNYAFISEIKNQALLIGLKLFRLNSSRIFRFTSNNVIPELMKLTFVGGGSRKSLTIPILCEMARTSQCRPLLKENDLLLFLIGMLEDEYWAPNSLEAICSWFNEDRDYVEKTLLLNENLTFLIDLCNYATLSLESITNSLFKLITDSRDICFSLTIPSVIESFIGKINKLKNHPNIRINLLKLLLKMAEQWQNPNFPCDSTLISTLQDITNEGNFVIGSALATLILNNLQPIQK